MTQGSWRAKSALWIAMEYCSGGSISDIMAASDAPLDEDLIAYVCRETLAGLVYLHSMGKARALPTLMFAAPHHEPSYATTRPA